MRISGIFLAPYSESHNYSGTSVLKLNLFWNRCHVHPASLMHMMWNCPKLVRYWNYVISVIQSVFSVLIDATPLTCLLGYVEEVATDVAEKIAIARMLFIARKVIAYHWLDSEPPTLQEFIRKINWLLLLERGIYLKRGTPGKFEKLWARWLDMPNLASPQLTRYRLDAPTTRSPLVVSWVLGGEVHYLHFS